MRAHARSAIVGDGRVLAGGARQLGQQRFVDLRLHRTPIEAERALAATFAESTLVEIPDVGHLIHYETPQAAATAIEAFLAA